ncbi:hypothetical protein AB1Y20_014163 [Prymnesium parvum]|uniref:PARP catalytic domain-containing protein n=1 Tax=Prymnesium parvum TaxID=97485 RepID=A0AB34IFF8_PRYPA
MANPSHPPALPSASAAPSGKKPCLAPIDLDEPPPPFARRPCPKRAADSSVVDLTCSDDEDAAVGAPPPRVTIDLCGGGDEGEGKSFLSGLAHSLNVLLDDDVQIVGERKAGPIDVERVATEQAAAARQALLRAKARGEVVDVEEMAARDVLQEHRARIRGWLQSQANFLRIIQVWPNPEAEPGGTLYARFAQAYLEAEDKTVRLVFHGSPEANISAICKHGLDPARRGLNGQALGRGEYFAEQPMLSLPYCKGGSKLLVFAVLMDSSGLTTSKAGIVVVHKSEHQLPLFVVSFDPKLDMGAALASSFGRSFPSGTVAANILQQFQQKLLGSSSNASRGRPPVNATGADPRNKRRR